jgi:hypothetical protein
MQYLHLLSHMNYFFHFSDMDTHSCIFISLFISVNAFISFSRQYYVIVDCTSYDTHEAVLMAAQSHGREFHTDLVCYTSTNDSYGVIVPSETIGISSDSVDGDKQELSYLESIDEMYDICFELADSGGQGIRLEPPQMPFKKCKQRYDSFMPATLMDPVSQETYSRWLSKEQHPFWYVMKDAVATI